MICPNVGDEESGCGWSELCPIEEVEELAAETPFVRVLTRSIYRTRDPSLDLFPGNSRPIHLIRISIAASELCFPMRRRTDFN